MGENTKQNILKEIAEQKSDILMKKSKIMSKKLELTNAYNDAISNLQKEKKLEIKFIEDYTEFISNWSLFMSYKLELLEIKKNKKINEKSNKSRNEYVNLYINKKKEIESKPKELNEPLRIKRSLLKKFNSQQNELIIKHKKIITKLRQERFPEVIFLEPSNDCLNPIQIIGRPTLDDFKKAEQKINEKFSFDILLEENKLLELNKLEEELDLKLTEQDNLETKINFYKQTNEVKKEINKNKELLECIECSTGLLSGLAVGIISGNPILGIAISGINFFGHIIKKMM